ncbi:MAG: hypothetical protein QNL18_07910 [Pseudomonadales bacterium]
MSEILAASGALDQCGCAGYNFQQRPSAQFLVAVQPLEDELA